MLRERGTVWPDFGPTARCEPVPDTETEFRSPVFVDPAGRRSRVLSAIALATAIVTAGYLTLVLLAVLGAPLGPGAELPPPARGGTGGTAEVAPTSTEMPLPLAPRAPNGDAQTSEPSRTTAVPTAASQASQAAEPTATTDRRSTAKPEPPGQGKAPTTPPGHG